MPASFAAVASPLQGHGVESSRPDADEDAYEAALRAADALFAPARAAPPPPARRAAPRSETGRPGRILQAIEEPTLAVEVVPDLVEAPKRRGRKPGSKNKPKVAPLRAPVPDLASLARAALLMRPVPPAGPAHRPVADKRMPTVPAMVASGTTALAPAVHAPVAHAATQPRTIPATEMRPARTRRTEPFAWVRTKLGPGEGWKRKLPKVCW